MSERAPAGIRGWILPALLILTIFFASGERDVAGPNLVNFDKVAHASIFGLLATLIARTQPPRRFWVGFAAASLYGVADEIRQSFTPGRSVEVADWVADTVGAALAVFLYARWGAYRRLLELPVRLPSRFRQVAFRSDPMRDNAP